MIVEGIRDAGNFLAEAGALLLADEARHNLILGLADTIQANPETYPDRSLVRAPACGTARRARGGDLRASRTCRCATREGQLPVHYE